MSDAQRGEVWLVDLDPVIGHEQGRRRPGVVLSAGDFNRGPSNLLTIVPLTSCDRGIRFHVRVALLPILGAFFASMLTYPAVARVPVTSGTGYVTHGELAQTLRELELRIEVRLGDMENRLLRDIGSRMNWTIGVLIGALLPVYAALIVVVLFLYNAKP